MSKSYEGKKRIEKKGKEDTKVFTIHIQRQSSNESKMSKEK